MTSETKLGIVILSFFIGCVGGLGIAGLMDKGLFETWHSLGSPPNKGVDILDTNGDSVYVKASDGKVYICQQFPQDKCWEETDWPIDIGPKYLCGPTDLWSVNPPSNVVDSIEISYCPFIESGVQVKYVVLTNGSIWTWRHSTSGMLSFGIYVYNIGLGAVGGLLLGMLITTVSKTKRP
jgi:hypothetical protein